MSPEAERLRDFLLEIRGCAQSVPNPAMGSNRIFRCTKAPDFVSLSQIMSSNSTPERLQTADDIAAFLKVSSRTVYLWAEGGRIPVAYRNGKTVRFRLADVQESLVPGGDTDRHVELTVFALGTVFGDLFPRVPKINPGTITMDEQAEIERLCKAYLEAKDELTTPEEQVKFCEGVMAAAEEIAKMEQEDE